MSAVLWLGFVLGVPVGVFVMLARVRAMCRAAIEKRERETVISIHSPHGEVLRLTVNDLRNLNALCGRAGSPVLEIRMLGDWCVEGFGGRWE